MDSRFGAGADCHSTLDHYNEIMANSIDEDTGEFIELKNVGKKAIDLFDWRMTDGDATDILCSPTSKERPRVTTLGNGLQLNDPITLSNSQKQVVDTFTPTFKAKNGFSIEQLSARAANTEENWQLSRNATGPTPGRPNSQNQTGSEPVNPDFALLVKIWINELLLAP